MAKKPFKGVIKLDVRDSKSRTGTPYTPTKAPEGAPNVLFVLYDDTGLAAWSPFGGRINMPTLQKLADNGLMYSQWHTTALCSPTRSTFLTGRNHHLNGMRLHHRGGQRLPRRARPHSRRSAPPSGRSCRTTAAARSGWARTTTSPRRTSPPGASRKRVAAAEGLRPLLRLPRRRDQPVVSRPGRGQPLHRPAVLAGGGLSPLQGPRRPGDRR